MRSAEASAYGLQQPTSPARYMTEFVNNRRVDVEPAGDHDVMSYPETHRDVWDAILDKYRCGERDGLGSRCQLVVGHDGQHLLERDGSAARLAGGC